jgi:hypothetical protein
MTGEKDRPAKGRRRVVRRVLLAAVALYLLWQGGQVLLFKRYVSDLRPASSVSPLFEAEGAYHMHSRFSDGRKTADAIAKVAARAGLDFIILTDHGGPNFASLEAQGRKDGVLVLAGSELSTNRGHLVALGFGRPDSATRFSQDAETAAGEVGALGGFTVIAHPYSKVRWSWGTAVFDGIEIIDADSMLRRHVFRALSDLPAFLLRPSCVLLKTIDPPEQTLRKWDELLRQRYVTGFFSADAHIFYGAIFPVFHLHIVLDRPLEADDDAARRQVFDALRAGRFFSAVDGAAAARGFRFELRDGALHVAAPFSFAHETIIIRDGLMIHKTRDTDITLAPPGPGVYRVEVYLRERSPLNPAAPWIVSNPVVFGR